MNSLKYYILFVCSIYILNGFSQSSYTSSNNFLYHLYDRNEISNTGISDDLFSAVKPYYRRNVIDALKNNDSFNNKHIYLLYRENRNDFNINYLLNECNDPEKGMTTFSKKIIQNFYISKSQLLTVRKTGFTMIVNPVFAFGYGYNKSVGNLSVNTRGVEIRGTISDKIGYYTFMTDNQTFEPVYVKNYIDSHSFVMPGVGYLKKFKKYNNAYDYFISRGYITFQPVKNVDVMFGQDRNFIGNGLRSLILSDLSKDYLQLKVNTKVWKFNYLNIFSELTDYQKNMIGSGIIPPKKYMAFHHLSMNISKNLNIGLSETIIFARNDSNANQGYDINYLNPVIFYRSIEQNNNSVDNSMIAVDWKWNFLKRFSYYGQLVFDELIISHLRKQDGHWTNKYAIQNGIKYINVFGIKHLDVQGEFNIIRPYMYTHFKNSTNFSNYGIPLAHPLGSNLKEYIAIIRYQPIKKIYITAQYFQTSYGADTGNTHWGNNIFADYKVRQLQGYPNYDLGNSITQGILTKINYINISVAYMPVHNLILELSYIYRNQQSKVKALDLKTNFFQINLRYNLSKREMLF